MHSAEQTTAFGLKEGAAEERMVGEGKAADFPGFVPSFEADSSWSQKRYKPRIQSVVTMVTFYGGRRPDPVAKRPAQVDHAGLLHEGTGEARNEWNRRLWSGFFVGGRWDSGDGVCYFE